jgi:hypothetical protein
LTLEFELKYVIPNHRLSFVLEFLKARCNPDPVFQSATISSIYFDSTSLHFLDEKINSDFYKNKIRIRWYKDTQTKEFSRVAYLENKKRFGSQRLKPRTPFKFSPELLDTLPLEDSRLLNVEQTLAEMGFISPQPIFPTILIQYKRQRFVDPVYQTRISVDSDIRSPRVNRLLLPSGGASTLQLAVVEIKGKESFLQQNLSPLITLGLRKASFSKYLSCMARSHNMTFDPR